MQMLGFCLKAHLSSRTTLSLPVEILGSLKTHLNHQYVLIIFVGRHLQSTTPFQEKQSLNVSGL